MNIKVKTLVFLLVLAVSLPCMLTGHPVPEHSHQYGPVWSYDAENHWQTAICTEREDCSEAITSFAPHAISDGVCSLCGYQPTPVGDGDTEGGSDNISDNNGSGSSENPDVTPPDVENGTVTPETPNPEDPDPENPDPENPDPDGAGNDDTPAECTHQYLSVTENPTCTNAGSITYTCILCADSYTESVDPLGHTEQTVDGTPPTCTETGLSKGKKCSVCGEILLPQHKINPLGHSFTEGVCTVCGEVDPDHNVDPPDTIRVNTTANNCWVDKVSFTAEESGEYTFTLPAGLGAWDGDDHAHGSPGPVVDSLHPNYIARETPFTVRLAAGTVYEFYVAASRIDSWTIGWSLTPCEVSPDGPGGDEPVDPDVDISGVYEGTDAFGNQLLEVIIDSALGTVVFDYYHPLTGPNVVNATYVISGGSILLYNANGDLLHPLSGTLTLENGVPATASFNATQYFLTLKGEDDGGDEAPDEEIKVIDGIMTDGQRNSFNVTADNISVDKMYVLFTPSHSGAYDFVSSHLFVATIFYREGGSPSRDRYDRYLLTEGEEYIVEINLEYIATPGDYTITPIYQYPAGHENNPDWYILGEEEKLTYGGDGSIVWYQFYADLTGVFTIQIATPGVKVVMSAAADFVTNTIETRTLEVVKGRKYYFGLSAEGSAEPMNIKFIASVKEGEITTDGSLVKPHSFTIGTNTATLSGGSYFIYRAVDNGNLTLTQNGGFTWAFANLPETGELTTNALTLHLNIGDLVYIYIQPDAVGSEISFKATFVSDPKKAWEDGPFALDGSTPTEIIIEENTYVWFQIRGTVGRFLIHWDNSNATVIYGDEIFTNNSVVEITDAWFGPVFNVFLEGYAAGIVNITIVRLS